MTNGFKDIEKRCAPGKKFTDGSCFTLEQLVKIGNQINKKFSTKINTKNSTKKQLLRDLTNELKDKYDCDDQLCWLNLDVVEDLEDEEIKKFTFRPPGPDRGTKWLNTTNIDLVLEQYEKTHPDFISFGAVPLDFKDIPILKMNKPEYSLDNLCDKKQTKIGIVFNHDYSNMGGSHWVAMYIDLLKGQIYYFDSYGIKEKKEIAEYVEKVKQFIKSKKIEPIYLFNSVRHQFKGSECGVYSINFILRLLKGESFKEITENVTKDDDINLCRRVYFTS